MSADPNQVFMLVLVVGATGVLGSATVRRLRAAGQRVRGMTRHARRMPDVEALGAERIGDLTDAASLARACAGVDRVFAAAHGALGRGRYRSETVDDAGHRALIDAARHARVGRFVYTSALGAAPNHPVDFFRTKWATERYLAASGLAYVVLRPSALMEWHAHAFNGKAVLEKGRAVIPGSGSKPRNFVAARDVANIRHAALWKTCRARACSRSAARSTSATTTWRDCMRGSQVSRNESSTFRATCCRRSDGSCARCIRASHARYAVESPDHAFAETFDAASSGVEREIGPTTLEAFVRDRVRERVGALPVR